MLRTVRRTLNMFKECDSSFQRQFINLEFFKIKINTIKNCLSCFHHSVYSITRPRTTIERWIEGGRGMKGEEKVREQEKKKERLKKEREKNIEGK